jgi:hypothetical protein
MASDSFPFALVGTDAVNWHKIEPNPPINGVHSYNWGAIDTIVYYTMLAGKKLDIGIRPLSNWGTVLPADSVPVSEWAMVMSAIKPDSLSDTAAWGMTARQAWKEFIFNFVERYDGDADGNPGIPNINKSMIKTLTMGNEVEAPGHFFAGNDWDPRGTMAKYKEILQLAYDTAKYANPDIIIARGKSNPGHIFDDLPDDNTVYNRRKDFFDSINAGLDLGPDYFDVYTFNYNDNYTSLLGYSKWVKDRMQQRGFSKRFMVGDARTTLYPRDNFFVQDKIMPSIYSPADTFLTDTNSTDYTQLKKQWQKDKVQQSIRKLAVAAATGQYQISLQPVYVVRDFEQGPVRTYMWMYSGFFDPYVYESTGSLAYAREPLYWSLKMFANAVMGSSKQAVNLIPGGNIYAFKYINTQGTAPVVIWHENIMKTDAMTGKLQRNQDTVIDMSNYFTSPYVLIKKFYTEVDNYGMPVSQADTIVSVNSVPINEFPVMLYPSAIQELNEIHTGFFFEVYPNPVRT